MTALDLETLTLRKGAHGSPEDGVCLLEAVAFFAGEPHTDAPECVDETLARFGRAWNDGLRTDAERAQLVPYVQALVGTAGTAEDAGRRSWMALDWAVRVSTPAWLELAGLEAHADRLRELPPVVAPDSEVLAAWDAARDAAWDSAKAAARDTAWAAARAAAWDAAKAAAGAAAGGAAKAAAWDSAKAAARDTAWAAAKAAAGAASRESLAPTVTALQASAHRLYLGMIAAGPHNPAALAVARATVLGGAS